MDSSSKDKYSGKAQPAPGKTGGSNEMVGKDKMKSAAGKPQDRDHDPKKSAAK